MKAKDRSIAPCEQRSFNTAVGDKPRRYQNGSDDGLRPKSVASPLAGDGSLTTIGGKFNDRREQAPTLPKQRRRWFESQIGSVAP